MRITETSARVRATPLSTPPYVMPELELSTYLLNPKLWIHHAASAKQRIQNQGTKAHNTPKAQNASGITTPEYPQHTKLEQTIAIQTLVSHLGRDRSL
jgi:hypothetical protein